MSKRINGLIEFGDFRFDPENRVLWFDGRQIHLPLKELDVLSVLVAGRGELVTKEHLLERVWGGSFVEESNLSRQIYLLRKTFKDFGVDGLIETVPRRGYRFTADLRDTGCADASVTFEKYTESQTLIEIEGFSEQPNGKTEPGRHILIRPFRFGSYRQGVPLVLAGTALLISVIAFAAYRTRPDAGSAAGIRSIAVLPFQSIDPNGENAHQSLGLADVLITRLSNVKEISVRSFAAVSNFDDEDPAEFGRRLQTDAVLEGSIFRADGKVRVTARLIKTADGSVIWTGEFEKVQRDEMKLQNEIALRVADALAVNLGGRERNALLKLPTDNYEALEFYQKGRVEWNKRSAEGMVEAERLFRNAIEKDPNFALAYAGLADILVLDSARSREMWDAVRRALELDPNLAEAYASLGFIEMFFNWEWRRAEDAFKKSLDLNPNYATAHHWYAQLLAVQGRHEEAKAAMRRALEINPVSHNYLADLGQIHYFNREYPEAEEYCRKALAIYPEFGFARFYLYQIYLKTGDHDRAVEEILAGDKTAASLPNESAEHRRKIEASLEGQRSIYREGGIKKFIEHRTSETRDGSACYIFAQNYAFLGETEKALACLENASSGRAFLTAFIKAEPAFDPLRTNQRYTRILGEMKLIETE